MLTLLSLLGRERFEDSKSSKHWRPMQRLGLGANAHILQPLLHGVGAKWWPGLSMHSCNREHWGLPFHFAVKPLVKGAMLGSRLETLHLTWKITQNWIFLDISQQINSSKKRTTTKKKNPQACACRDNKPPYFSSHGRYFWLEIVYLMMTSLQHLTRGC